jgi:hypothetical protein
MTRHRLALCACGRHAGSMGTIGRDTERASCVTYRRQTRLLYDRELIRGDDHSSASCREAGPGVAAQIRPQRIRATDGSGLTHALQRRGTITESS